MGDGRQWIVSGSVVAVAVVERHIDLNPLANVRGFFNARGRIFIAAEAGCLLEVSHASRQRLAAAPAVNGERRGKSSPTHL